MVGDVGLSRAGESHQARHRGRALEQTDQDVETQRIRKDLGDRGWCGVRMYHRVMICRGKPACQSGVMPGHLQLKGQWIRTRPRRGQQGIEGRRPGVPMLVLLSKNSVSRDRPGVGTAVRSLAPYPTPPMAGGKPVDRPTVASSGTDRLGVSRRRRRAGSRRCRPPQTSSRANPGSARPRRSRRG